TAPVDDPASTDPATHKILTTRVDGSITVPQSGGEPLTYVITNNLNAFYFVRGDSATGLDSSQPADARHWYVYKWVDLTTGLAPNRAQSKNATWAGIKARYR
ncbi:MAG TPA: hypothetical protein VKF80_08085, partial [Candidatus Eisenbacteria bacterium]|nr:hypothetical protein [Candidatus Eisenbacteria bacterium]